MIMKKEKKSQPVLLLRLDRIKRGNRRGNEETAPVAKLPRAIKDSSLSVVLFALFVDLHARAKFCRLVAAKRDFGGTREGVDRLLA